MVATLRFNRRLIGAVDSRLLAVPSPIPSAPTVTAEEDGGYPAIVLTISATSPYATSHHIEVSADGSTGWTEIAEIPAYQTWYIDDGLNAGETWYYRVASEGAAGTGSYSSVVDATTFDISTVSDVAWWWEADQAEIYTDHGTTPVASDNDDVGQINDQSGNSHTFQEISTKPKWRTNVWNGLPAIQFQSGRGLVSTEAASAWKFLHDGTKYITVFHIYKGTTLDPNALYCLMGTGNLSSAGVGFNLFYDDRTAQARQEQLIAYVAKGTSGTFYVNGVGPESAARNTVLQVAGYREQSGGTWEGGANGEWGYQAAGFAPSGTRSTSDPTYTNYLGSYGAGTGFDFVGYLFGTFVVASNSAMSDALFHQINDHFCHKYGAFRNAYWGTPSVIKHETTGKDHVAFGSGCYTHNGKLIVAYQKATDHASQDADLFVRIRSAAGVWGTEVKLWDYEDDGSSNVMYGTPSLTRDDDNRIWMAVGRREGAAPALVVDGLALWYSDDAGLSWTGPVSVDGHFTSWNLGDGGGIYQDSTGRLHFPHYGLNSGDTAGRYSIADAYSDDDGATWGTVLIRSGQSNSQGYAEVGIIEDENNLLWAIYRVTTDSPERIFRVRSSDFGDTWDSTQVTVVQAGNGLQRPSHIDASGSFATLIRSNLTDNLARLCFRKAGEDQFQMVGKSFTYSANVGAGGRMTYGNIAVHPDGKRMTAVYFSENSAQTVSDAMIVETT